MLVWMGETKVYIFHLIPLTLLTFDSHLIPLTLLTFDSHLIPLTLLTFDSCDQDRISPHNISTISSRQMRRIKKNINEGIS